MAVITREIVAEMLAAYLQHKLPLDSVVAWAESALMDGEFDPAHLPTIRDIVARIGVADVRAFGLTPHPTRLVRASQHLLPDSFR